MWAPNTAPNRAGVAESSATERPTNHRTRSPCAVAHAWSTLLARPSRSTITLAEGARDRPRSLEAAKNCCHHVDAFDFVNWPGALRTGWPLEAVFKGAAAVVPPAAIRAPANITAAPDARGFLDQRRRWPVRRVEAGHGV